MATRRTILEVILFSIIIADWVALGGATYCNLRKHSDTCTIYFQLKRCLSHFHYCYHTESDCLFSNSLDLLGTGRYCAFTAGYLAYRTSLSHSSVSTHSGRITQEWKG
ncbi:hypothetical protein LIA77_07145 [Sarocladium implicatum]|nr:hypothetical protein LIA77_07145 [Sarocladium implicatum]